MRPILAELRSKAYSGTLLIAEFRKRMIIVKCAGTFETRKEIRSAEPQYSREGACLIDDRGRSPHAVPDDAEQAHRSFFAGAADIQKSHLPPFSATRDVVHADLRAGNSGNIHDAGLHSGRGSGNAKNAYLNGRRPREVSDTDLHCAHGRRCVRNAHLSAREGIRTDIQNAYLPADGRINDDIRHTDLRPVHFLSDIQSRRNLRAFDVSRIIQRNGSLNASGTFLSDVCKQTQLQAQKRTVRLGHKQSEHHALARFSFDVEQINAPARFSILLQGIKSIVSVSARCRALHGDFRKSVRSERRAPVLRERHIRGRCLGRAFHLHAVNAPSKPELKLAATHLAEFRDKRPGCIADEHASFDVRAEHEPGGSSTDIRHHHVTRAREVHIPARMLHAAESRLRILKRFVERELIRLRKRHLAVSGNIARAAEPAHQGLRKERAAQTIALLAGFILRARSDERIALHIARSVRHESRDGDTALDPGNRAGAAGVNHGNFHIRMERVNAFAERAPAVKFIPYTEPAFIRVPAVIEEYFLARTAFLRELFIKCIEFILYCLHGRIAQKHFVQTRDAAHFHKHLGKSRSVALRIAEHGAVVSAVVRAHGEKIAFDGNRSKGGAGAEKEEYHESSAEHINFLLYRKPCGASGIPHAPLC